MYILAGEILNAERTAAYMRRVASDYTAADVIEVAIIEYDIRACLDGVSKAEREAIIQRARSGNL